MVGEDANLKKPRMVGEDANHGNFVVRRSPFGHFFSHGVTQTTEDAYRGNFPFAVLRSPLFAWRN